VVVVVVVVVVAAAATRHPFGDSGSGDQRDPRRYNPLRDRRR